MSEVGAVFLVFISVVLILMGCFALFYKGPERFDDERFVKTLRADGWHQFDPHWSATPQKEEASNMTEQRRIKSLEDLYEMVAQKKSVIVPNSFCWNKPRPAAFMMQLSGEVLMRLFENGMFEYQPKTKGDKNGKSKSRKQSDRKHRL